jgi:hypothetical protein
MSEYEAVIRDLQSSLDRMTEDRDRYKKLVEENLSIGMWKEEVQDKLLHIIKVWETKMGDEDKTLYTLGVRRALDIAMGREVQT